MSSRKLTMSENSTSLSLQPSTSLSFKDVSNYFIFIYILYVYIFYINNISLYNIQYIYNDAIYIKEHPISNNSNITNFSRERDKSYKRKSYLNRSLNMETAKDHLNQCK